MIDTYGFRIRFEIYSVSERSISPIFEFDITNNFYHQFVKRVFRDTLITSSVKSFYVYIYRTHKIVTYILKKEKEKWKRRKT